MNNFLNQFGQRAKNRRLELSFSLEEVAKKAGYNSRTAIMNIEKGMVDLPQSRIIKLAKALDTTPAYLMGWEEKNNVKKEVVQILDGLSESDQEKILAFARGIQAARQNGNEGNDIKYSLG